MDSRRLVPTRQRANNRTIATPIANANMVQRVRPLSLVAVVDPEGGEKDDIGVTVGVVRLGLDGSLLGTTPVGELLLNRFNVGKSDGSPKVKVG